LCNDPTKTPTKPAEISFSDQILVLARKDDHNPFFQISATLNAWIMMQVVGWEPRQTRLLQLDGGFPSAVDELQRRILSPNHEMIFGLSLLNKTVHFESMLLAPYEVSGPMMQHLDNKEPCYDSDLVKKFRAISLSKFGISDKKSNPNMCTITIITRRNYGGRVIQRRWVNEDDIVDHMREDYEYCTFQSIDFVDLSLEKQMTIAKESDMIIGMHGAGMVNVFWSRPGTQIIEIFPKKRFRWGYRNLCQFIGCDWIEFRGGVDIGNGDNASDKAIFYEEWKEFFDPLYEKLIKKVFNE
jgi:glycoprotein 2-beta-D-xylosyltransferase